MHATGYYIRRHLYLSAHLSSLGGQGPYPPFWAIIQGYLPADLSAGSCLPDPRRGLGLRERDRSSLLLSPCVLRFFAPCFRLCEPRFEVPGCGLSDRGLRLDRAGGRGVL